MQRLLLEQGSQAWLDYRDDHIMATDASIIMGSNHFKDPFRLWEEKVGFKERDSENAAMRRGRELEDEARLVFNSITKLGMVPCVCESNERPWQAASLDGISACGRYILEIKCPGENTHQLAYNEASIRPYYMTQIQHQLSVTDAWVAYYMSYRPESNPRWAIMEIVPDREYMELMCEKELEFYSCVKDMRMPEKTWVLNLIAH